MALKKVLTHGVKVNHAELLGHSLCEGGRLVPDALHVGELDGGGQVGRRVPRLVPPLLRHRYHKRLLLEHGDSAGEPPNDLHGLLSHLGVVLGGYCCPEEPVEHLVDLAERHPPRRYRAGHCHVAYLNNSMQRVPPKVGGLLHVALPDERWKHVPLHHAPVEGLVKAQEGQRVNRLPLCPAGVGRGGVGEEHEGGVSVDLGVSVDAAREHGGAELRVAGYAGEGEGDKKLDVVALRLLAH
mmetsp:Transcript_41973/g.102445  ORF Transcript_41973/g.102445 Transcript_41973/m.102445 type:complete len:240 (-) Transcript_41973:1089-1808(-)